MPRIPIIRPRDVGAGGPGGGSGPEALPPDHANALQALEARTARIDRELAVSQSWSAAVDRLAQAEDAEDGPPPGFTRSFLEEADKEHAAMLKSLPPDRQGDLEQDLLSLRSDFADRAASAEASGLALRRRSGLYRALDGYRTGVTRDPGLFDEAVMRMDSLSSDLGLSEERLASMRHEVRDVLGNSAVDGLMDDPDRAARVLSEGLFDDVLSESSKTRRLSEAQTEAARRTLLSREQSVSGLTAQARQGTAPDEAILAAERDGMLAPVEAVHLRQANAKAAEEATLRTARIERVTTAAEPFDPSDPEDQAAVSTYWDSVSEVHASDDPGEQKEREFGFVGRTGILPDGLSGKYQGALLSADPTIAVSGAMALSELHEMNPALLDGIPEDRLRKAQSIADYASLDLPPERAIELAEQDIETQGIEPEAGFPIQSGVADSGKLILPVDEPIAAEPGEPSLESRAAPGAESPAASDSDRDQTDGPFDFDSEPPLGGEQAFDEADVTDGLSELSDEEVDDLLRQDGLAPIPRGYGVQDVESFPEEASALNRFVAVQRNEFLAAQQWTSPDTDRYEKLGRYVELDAGGAFIDGSGQSVLVDTNRHAVLIDSQRGELSVNRRTPVTDESRILSLGRLLGAGLGAGSTGTLVGTGIRGVQTVTKGKTGAAATLGSGIGPTGKGTAETISGAAKGEAWIVEKAIPGTGQGAGSVHKVSKPGKATYAGEGTSLILTHKEPVAAEVLKSGRPLGLADDATFEGFKTILREEGVKLPPDTRFAIRGSAVTGNGFDTTSKTHAKDFFDVGRKSDYDIAIVSRTLFEKARESGVGLRQGGTRTDVLDEKATSKLSLEPVLQRIRVLTDRKKTGLMIYRSLDALNKRGVNMHFDLK